ncbi:MAG: ATP-binding protein [Spirochaetales bacterium]|nr:ATP-binding protein [Spirochaetales bacterium]
MSDTEIKEIFIDDNHEFLNQQGMFYKEFPSDYRQIRYFTLLVVQKAPPEIKEINLLEQQVSELIKNAVKHGNKNDINKKVKVWYLFDKESARLIVEDEGEGFKELEKWNEFNRKRTECFVNQDFENMATYVSFRTKESDDNDGGNALFAAVEYWNDGVVFTNKKNCIAVKKKFPQKRHGVEIG